MPTAAQDGRTARSSRGGNDDTSADRLERAEDSVGHRGLRHTLHDTRVSSRRFEAPRQ